MATHQKNNNKSSVLTFHITYFSDIPILLAIMLLMLTTLSEPSVKTLEQEFLHAAA